jgi:predicted permease
MWEMFRRRRLDRELDDEIAAQLTMQAEEFRRQGMSAGEAEAAARRAFGGVAQAKEDYRERRGGAWIEGLGRDVFYALRGLRHAPGFTAAAVISLGLGIGANAAIFSLFHSLMLRMLPVERPQELVGLHCVGGWTRGYISYPLFQELAKRTDLFQGAVARTPVMKVRFTPRSGAREQFVQREFVSGNYFQVLGVRPTIGRVFTDEDNVTPGGHPIAILSYDLWRSQYGADPAVLGTKILVDEQPFTVVGVAAAGFHGVEVERRANIWAPTMMSGMKISSPRTWWLWVMARRRPEVTVPQVQAAINVLMQQHLDAIYPATYNPAFRKRALEQRLEVRDGAVGISQLREEFGRPLTVLMAGVVLVMLAACANVANLLLARGAAHRKEIALRLSLGATRGRLARQALTESILLMLGGSALGLGLAAWGRQVLLHFLPASAGDPFGSMQAQPVLWFALGVATLSVVLFGVAPAMRSTAVDPAAGLRPGQTGPAGRPLLRRALVVAQVAFSVVLVSLAALFGHNLWALREVDLGFRAENVAAFELDMPRAMQNQTATTVRQFARQMEGMPGVTSVSYAFPGPFQMGFANATLRVPGSEATARESRTAQTAGIAPRYFETIGTPLVVGREFDTNDTTGARRVAVVNEAFVREFLPGERHPEARHLSFDDSRPEGGEPTFIVGVARDIRHDGIQTPAKPTVYLPIQRSVAQGLPTFVVRTRSAPAALMQQLYRECAKIGPSIALQSFGTLRSHVDDSIYEQRALAAIGGAFGLVALLLAAVGLYGVVSYSTARRTSEIGIRIALGSPRPRVVWMILRDSLTLVAIGLVVGLPAALAAARAVDSILFGVRPADPLTFASTAVVLAAVGTAAAFLPAMRAATVDPSRVLRHE